MRSLALIVFAACTPQPPATTPASLRFDEAVPVAEREIVASAYVDPAAPLGVGTIVFTSDPPGTPCTAVDHWLAKLTIRGDENVPTGTPRKTIDVIAGTRIAGRLETSARRRRAGDRARGVRCRRLRGRMTKVGLA